MKHREFAPQSLGLLTCRHLLFLDRRDLVDAHAVDAETALEHFKNIWRKHLPTPLPQIDKVLTCPESILILHHEQNVFSGVQGDVVIDCWTATSTSYFFSIFGIN